MTAEYKCTSRYLSSHNHFGAARDASQAYMRCMAPTSERTAVRNSSGATTSASEPQLMTQNLISWIPATRASKVIEPSPWLRIRWVSCQILSWMYAAAVLEKRILT